MLELKHISKKYDERKIIDNLSIVFPDIGMIGIQGESGCGKSTLLSIIGMLDDDYEGEIIFNEEKIENPSEFIRKHLSFMMQNKDIISSMTVKENICLASQVGCKKINVLQMKKIVKQLGIDSFLHRYPYQLSGGQRKRVSIAKALLKEASIILCDEPTGALHHNQSHEIMSLLKKVSQERLVIIVSHDPSLLNEYCDEVLTFKNGKLEGLMPTLSYDVSQSFIVKKYFLIVYPLRQILFQRNKLMFLFLFQWILIVAFFLLMTAMNGIWDMIEESETSSVLSCMMTIEKHDGMSFETLPTLNTVQTYYQYDLSQCELYFGKEKKDVSFQFLPQNTNHIQLKWGRLPQKDNEVIVSQSLYQSLEEKQGNLKFVNNEIKLNIVGVLKPVLFEKKEMYISTLLKEYMNVLENRYEVVIEVQQDKVMSMYQELSENYIVYSEVLERKDSYQSLLSLARMVSYVFIGVSLIVSLILISIVQSIIYHERKHDVAYLLSLGLSYRHLFILSLFESLLLGFIIVLGGCLLSWFAYFYINHVYKLKDVFYFSLQLKPIWFSRFDLYIVIAFIYMFMVVTGGILPIRKMMQVSVHEVLREE